MLDGERNDVIRVWAYCLFHFPEFYSTRLTDKRNKWEMKLNIVFGFHLMPLVAQLKSYEHDVIDTRQNLPLAHANGPLTCNVTQNTAEQNPTIIINAQIIRIRLIYKAVRLKPVNNNNLVISRRFMSFYFRLIADKTAKILICLPFPGKP